ncbi:hypothetical protein I3842_14G091500 [Carya illinoinensis]|uniref:Protein FAR1-RELATED SEQUENCE n=1 Tax=Carya illinoinensis TaxID=32201 RepID=A0A922AJA3_CARIL|nr:hypothetical protein I3842_14G091500 [Carya illinoinensis]
MSKPRPTKKKIECKAKINAQKINGEWCLTTIELVHNHGLLSPQKSRYLRCHQNIDSFTKWKLEVNDRAGIRMNKNFNALVVEAGGFKNFEFIEKDCRNFIDKVRHLHLGKGGAGALLDYFDRKRDMDYDFYASMDLDDEERLRNVFWVDTLSKPSYLYFGDVVTFGMTYLINRYGMSFTPFVGANHHG